VDMEPGGSGGGGGGGGMGKATALLGRFESYSDITSESNSGQQRKIPCLLL
jgi:hypothetical protein